MVWKGRSKFNHTSVCVIATVFLVFGYGNLICAQTQAATEKPSSSSEHSTVKNIDVQPNVSSSNQSVTPATSNTSTSNTSTSSTSSPTSATTPKPTEATNPATAAPPTPAPPSGLTIHFVNDLQYDIFPVHHDTGNTCSYDEAAGKCVGGLPRLKSYMDKTRNHSGSIWLNTGNTLGGVYFKTLKFDTAQRAMNLLNFNATAIEPNVFKYGGDAGIRYINGLESAVVSNIDPAPKRKSVTFQVDKCNVSFIGFIDDSQLVQKVNGVTVNKSAESIKAEIELLKKEHKNSSNWMTVIIGATNLTNARALAKIEGVHLVLVSGVNWTAEAPNSTKQFLWEEVPATPNKRRVFIGSVKVNHTKVDEKFLVGEIHLPFTNGCDFGNSTFNVTNYTNVTSDDTASEFVKAELKRLNGTLTVNNMNLTGEKDLCGHKECSLGNLITDAMVSALQSSNIQNSNYTTIALFPAEHLIQNKIINPGPLKMTDLYELIDEDMYISSVLLNSQQLKALLEISIDCSVHSNSTDFFHMSEWLHVEYREKMEKNSRIVTIKTVNSNSMLLNPIDLANNTVLYNVSIPTCFLNMSAYNKTLEGVKPFSHSVSVLDAVTTFINNTRYLHLPAIGSRYVQLEPKVEPQPAPLCEKHTGTTVIVTLILAALIIAGLYFGWRYFIRRYRHRSGSSLHLIGVE